jgi:hypothetical protein
MPPLAYVSHDPNQHQNPGCCSSCCCCHTYQYSSILSHPRAILQVTASSPIPQIPLPATPTRTTKSPGFDLMIAPQDDPQHLLPDPPRQRGTRAPPVVFSGCHPPPPPPELQPPWKGRRSENGRDDGCASPAALGVDPHTHHPHQALAAHML